MQSTNTRLVLALLIGGCLTFLGCEGDDDGDSGSSQNVAGSWQFTNQISGGPVTSVATITQNGSDITVSGDGMNFTGYVSGSRIYFVGPGFEVDTMEFEGTIHSATSMSGKGYDVQNGQRQGSGWDWSAAKL
jgi:hypothetical protein